MPSFDALEPLAPDACRSDPSAPCAYWHLKLHALNGGRDKLSERDLTFIGVDTWPITTPGWRSPVGLYLDDPLEGFGLSAEDSATLHAISRSDRRNGSIPRLAFPQPFPRPVVNPVPPDVTTPTRSAASTHETALGDTRRHALQRASLG